MLELDQVSRRYGSNVALDQLTFEVQEGEVVGFLGPNGAGKTTAMRAILGIIRPDAGTMRWKSQAIDLNARLNFGYMPEERGLYTTMVIIEQLVYLGRLHGMSGEKAKQAALEWLEILGVADRANERLEALSMGNQQRVQMAAALVHSPGLLVLDEPFSGLDPVGIEALGQVLRDRAKQGVAVVFSSHQLDLVEGLCERVVIINKGTTVITGSVHDLTTATDILRVEVDADPSWTTPLQEQGAEVRVQTDNNVIIRVPSTMSPDTVLDLARSSGSVRHFSFQRKRLSDVFKEAVSR